jgi:porphobilinogen deaminase
MPFSLRIAGSANPTERRAAQRIAQSLRKQGHLCHVEVFTKNGAIVDGDSYAAAVEYLQDKRADVAVVKMSKIPAKADARAATAAVLHRTETQYVLVHGPDANLRDSMETAIQVSVPSALVEREWQHRHPTHLLLREDDVTAAERVQRLLRGRRDAGVFVASELAEQNLQDEVQDPLPWLVPPAQAGAVALLVRADDTLLRDYLAELHHAPTAWAAAAEQGIAGAIAPGKVAYAVHAQVPTNQAAGMRVVVRAVAYDNQGDRLYLEMQHPIAGLTTEARQELVQVFSKTFAEQGASNAR